MSFRKTLSRQIVAYAATFCALETATARPLAVSSYNDMMKAADVVVIADAVSTSDTDDNGERNDVFAEVETTLRIDAVVKGKAAKPFIKFVHLRIASPDALKAMNGPRLVTFDTDGQYGQFNVAGVGDRRGQFKSKYMLFLKHREDGRYEGITGVHDAAESVRKLTAPSEAPQAQAGALEQPK